MSEPKHDCKEGEHATGIFVKDGTLDVRYLAWILRTLHNEGRVVVTGVKRINLPRELLEACAEAAEVELEPIQ